MPGVAASPPPPKENKLATPGSGLSQPRVGGWEATGLLPRLGSGVTEDRCRCAGTRIVSLTGSTAASSSPREATLPSEKVRDAIGERELGRPAAVLDPTAASLLRGGPPKKVF